MLERTSGRHLIHTNMLHQNKSLFTNMAFLRQKAKILPTPELQSYFFSLKKLFFKFVRVMRTKPEFSFILDYQLEKTNHLNDTAE